MSVDESSRSPGRATSTDDAERMLVELLADGRLRSSSPDAGSFALGRLQRAELLRTNDRWAVLRCLTPPGPPHAVTPRGREVIAAGAISPAGIAIIDLVGFLGSSYQTGVFVASAGDTERAVYLHKGDVVWASSSDPKDRLGEFLHRHGKISREQLQAALQDGEKRIGQACVARGFISAHELYVMVQAQLTEIFDNLLRTEAGVWSFARVSEESLAASQIHLSTQGLLVDALRRLDELQVYRQKIQSAAASVQRAQNLAPEKSPAELVEGLEAVVREGAQVLLGALVKPMSVAEVMKLLQKSEFEATRVVYHMVRAGLVELVEGLGTGPIPHNPPDMSHIKVKEMIGVYSLCLRELFEEVGRTGGGDGLRQAVDALLRDAGNQYHQVFARVTLGEDGAIAEAPLIDGVHSGAATVSQLGEALNELLFFILFQATELLGRRRGDNVARRVKLIYGMLGGAKRTQDVAGQ